MLSVDEALNLVLQQAQPLPLRMVGLPEALGGVLAEAVTSDIDSPPHDKSVVDGFAVVSASLNEGTAELSILEEIVAGSLPTRKVEPGTTTRIMTGAPLPPEADAVVPIEQTVATAEGKIRIVQSPVRLGQNIMLRAVSLARGETVLKAGTRLRAIELGLLAEVGRSQAPLFGQPSMAILATGNELVEAAFVPGAGQIRNSNGPLLAGLVRQTGCAPIDLGIARDEAAELRAKISAGLAHDVLVLSGGVSAGVLDLVPQILTDLGVEQIFHKVNLKPGKPLWFGVMRRDKSLPPVLVFGLPGNPVSSLVCFELFVRPAIEKMQGQMPTGLRRIKARLAGQHQQRGERPTYWPAVLRGDGAEKNVTPLPWHGSGDLRTLTDANCLALFPGGDRVFAAGEEIEVVVMP